MLPILDVCVQHVLVYQHLPKEEIKDSTPSQIELLKEIFNIWRGKSDIFVFKTLTLNPKDVYYFIKEQFYIPIKLL